MKGSTQTQQEKKGDAGDQYEQIVHLLVQASKKLLDTKSNVLQIPLISPSNVHQKHLNYRCLTSSDSAQGHPGETPLQMANRLKAENLAKILEKKGEQLMKERKLAEEKKIRNKPKVRRI